MVKGGGGGGGVGAVGKEGMERKTGMGGFLPAMNADPTKSGGQGQSGIWTRIQMLWILMAVGQESLLTFLLFWIGLYVSERQSDSLALAWSWTNADPSCTSTLQSGCGTW